MRSLPSCDALTISLKTPMKERLVRQQDVPFQIVHSLLTFLRFEISQTYLFNVHRTLETTAVSAFIQYFVMFGL